MNVETVLALKKAQEKFNEEMLNASNLYEEQVQNAEQNYRDKLAREVSGNVVEDTATSE